MACLNRLGLDSSPKPCRGSEVKGIEMSIKSRFDSPRHVPAPLKSTIDEAAEDADVRKQSASEVVFSRRR